MPIKFQGLAFASRRMLIHILCPYMPAHTPQPAHTQPLLDPFPADRLQPAGLLGCTVLGRQSGSELPHHKDKALIQGQMAEQSSEGWYLDMGCCKEYMPMPEALGQKMWIPTDSLQNSGPTYEGSPGDKAAATGSRRRCSPLWPGRIGRVGFTAGRLCALAAGAPPVGRGLSGRSALGLRSCCGGGSRRRGLLCAPNRGRIACCTHIQCHTKRDPHSHG